MKTIKVIGKRWHQRSCGNTYASSTIFVDGKEVHKVPYFYGYGNHYLTVAFEWLESNNYLKLARYTYAVQSPEDFCESNNIDLTAVVSDVLRKKDL